MNGRRTSWAALAVLLAFSALGEPASPLESLVKAERDFARLSVEQGMHVAFDANFADDGIWFSPHPEKTREALARRPKTPPRSTLAWYPTFSDVSAAGDLGFNTGPVLVTSKADPKGRADHGYFFSVWKRQADGAWKVAVDCGIDVPGSSAAETPASWRSARREEYSPGDDVSPDAEREAIRRRESELAQDVARRGLPDAYGATMASDFRVYRNGQPPFVAPAPLAGRLRDEGDRGRLAWEPKAVDVARSADLAYSWGSYARTPKNAEGPGEKGYYIHVWRRSGDARWRLAIEILRPLPEPPRGPEGG